MAVLWAPLGCITAVYILQLRAGIARRKKTPTGAKTRMPSLAREPRPAAYSAYLRLSLSPFLMRKLSADIEMTISYCPDVKSVSDDLVE